MSMAYTYMLGLLLALNTVNTVTPKSPKLSLRLIHRHSISSHFDHTSKEKINGKSLSAEDDDDLRAPVVAKEDGRGLFLVNISIGEPPVPQLLAMDTGSHLIWARCTLCDGCDYHVFDPNKSSTYSELSIESPQCSNNFVYDPWYQEYQCPFTMAYEDGSKVAGVQALDKLTFITSTGGTVEMHDAVFGCAQRAVGLASKLNGIFGLEASDKYSIVKRTGNKFSYCIGSIEDTKYKYNQLIFGEGAIIEGDSTPMRTKDNHYVVALEGISVGEKQLTINQQDFYYNVIIDSGSTYSMLRRSAYKQVVAEVRELLKGMVEPPEGRYSRNLVCYTGDLERDLKGFPIVTLHLAEGADLDLDVEGLFKRIPNSSDFCMAIVESDENLIGIVAQQNYNVGFDLHEKRISLQRIDCELLED